MGVDGHHLHHRGVDGNAGGIGDDRIKRKRNVQPRIIWIHLVFHHGSINYVVSWRNHNVNIGDIQRSPRTGTESQVKTII